MISPMKSSLIGLALLIIPAAIALFLWTRLGKTGNEEIREGVTAPDFVLPDQDNRTHALADSRGKWVVLYFYPKDDTPGCTTEACSFRDDIVEIRGLDAEVLGVSVDSTNSHAKFSEKYHLPFPLLVDAGGATAKQYGSLYDFIVFKFARRNTFLIDPEGKIRKIYHEVDPAKHSDKVIADLKQLSGT
jgi:peroxiredoxin Q/BCP